MIRTCWRIACQKLLVRLSLWARWPGVCVTNLYLWTSLISTVYLAIRLFGIVYPMETSGCFWCTLAMTKGIVSRMKAQYSQWWCNHAAKLSRKMSDALWQYCIIGYVWAPNVESIMMITDFTFFFLSFAAEDRWRYQGWSPLHDLNYWLLHS